MDFSQYAVRNTAQPDPAQANLGTERLLIRTIGGWPEDQACLGKSIAEVCEERFKLYLGRMRSELRMPLASPIDFVPFDSLAPQVALAGFHHKDEAERWGRGEAFIHTNIAPLVKVGLKSDALLPLLNFVALHELAHALDHSLEYHPSNAGGKAAYRVVDKQITAAVKANAVTPYFFQTLSALVHEFYIDGLALNLGHKFQAWSSASLDATERVDRLAGGYVLAFHGRSDGHFDAVVPTDDADLRNRFSLIGRIVLGRRIAALAEGVPPTPTRQRLSKEVEICEQQLKVRQPPSKYPFADDYFLSALADAAIQNGYMFNLRD